MTKHGVEISLALKIYKFFEDVYPDFHAKCWLGQGIHDKHVDNFIDDIILIIGEIENETD